MKLDILTNFTHMNKYSFGPVKYENFTTFDIKVESAIATVISYLGAVNA